MKRVAVLFSMVFLFAASALAQNTGTGTPNFGSFTASGLDSVNNQNLNVHVLVPFDLIAARGKTFSLPLTFDTMIWSPVTSGETTSWVPTGVDYYGQLTWGWVEPSANGPGGYPLYTFSYGSEEWCDALGYWTTDTEYSNFGYTDLQGTPHLAPTINYTVNGCTGAVTGTTADFTNDHTGYYLNRSSVWSRHGDFLGGLVRDSNGNYVSFGSYDDYSAWFDMTGNLGNL